MTLNLRDVVKVRREAIPERYFHELPEEIFSEVGKITNIEAKGLLGDKELTLYAVDWDEIGFGGLFYENELINVDVKIKAEDML